MRHIIRAVIFAECVYGYMYVGLYDSIHDRYELIGKVDLGEELRNSLDLKFIERNQNHIENCQHTNPTKLQHYSQYEFEKDLQKEKHISMCGQPINIITSKSPMEWIEPEVILELNVSRIEGSYGQCDYYIGPNNSDLIGVYPFQGKQHVTTLREVDLMLKIDQILHNQTDKDFNDLQD